MLKVFYDTGERQVASAKATQLDRAEWIELGAAVATGTRSFIGFVGADGTVLQIMAEGPDNFHVETPDPARRGSHAMQVNRAEYDRILREVDAPLANFITTLPLQFEAW